MFTLIHSVANWLNMFVERTRKSKTLMFDLVHITITLSIVSKNVLLSSIKIDLVIIFDKTIIVVDVSCINKVKRYSIYTPVHRPVRRC